MRAWGLLFLATSAWSQVPPALLSRLAEEAEVFRHAAPQIVAREVLVQTATVSRRFHPRIGAAARAPSALPVQTRQIVSEYSYGTLAEAPEVLHEFRQIISVDSRPISSPENARHALSLGLHGADDRARKRMLEDFQRYGLVGAVSDFGPLLLLFTKRRIPNYQFTPAGQIRIGSMPAYVLTYRQISGQESLLVFAGRHSVRQPLQGKIALRKPDGLPLQITLTTSRQEGRHRFRDEAVVTYTQAPRGFVAPAGVVHQGFADGSLMVEDRFQYGPFRQFGADTEVKFDQSPDGLK